MVSDLGLQTYYYWILTLVSAPYFRDFAKPI